MGDTEHARARREAMEASTSASAGANRQRLWAGMNRYLAAETEHAHHAAEQEDEDEAPRAPDGTDGADRPDPGDDPA